MTSGLEMEHASSYNPAYAQAVKEGIKPRCSDTASCSS